MASLHYVGMDIHKKVIAYCIKTKAGKLREEGTIKATRRELDAWISERKQPWVAAMEATLFTGWIYDYLSPHAHEIIVANPMMLKAISAAKKKNDRLDAEKLADLLRADLLPECYMIPKELRDLRRILRYRNLLVRESTRMKNRMTGLFMEAGVEYCSKKIHGKKYFSDLLKTLSDTPDSIVEMARFSKDVVEIFQKLQTQLVAGLKRSPLIQERVERLMTIDGVGDIGALTWALEVGDPTRFSSRRKAISYCGLCGAQKESAGIARRTPISKQRNKHLQSMLIELAKLAPGYNAYLARIHEREVARCNRNQATLEVARRLVGLMLAIDKSGKDYEPERHLKP